MMMRLTITALYVLITLVPLTLRGKPVKSVDKRFSISVTERQNHFVVSMRNGSLKLTTCSRAGRFQISQLGKEDIIFRTYHGVDDKNKRIVPDIDFYSLVKVIDEEKVKAVEILSNPFWSKGTHQNLRVKLSIQEDFPGVFVQSSIVNLSQEKSSCYFCWLTPMPSSKYWSELGESNTPMQWEKVRFDDWLYLPGTGSKSGFGIIMDELSPGIKFFTNQKSERAKGAWVISRTGRWFEQYARNEINFIILPASNIEEVKKACAQIKTRKVFPKFNLINNKQE